MKDNLLLEQFKLLVGRRVIMMGGDAAYAVGYIEIIHDKYMSIYPLCC